ncbi:hypothetical protein ACIGXM_19585 [Kitasatospora sp. NPDC052896]|uniref:hypothetical protein n=1 Tax=Kitasatospora sp. NPDC052896 TaxID=3364061 RepID=UPI0037C8336D
MTEIAGTAVLFVLPIITPPVLAVCLALLFRRARAGALLNPGSLLLLALAGASVALGAFAIGTWCGDSLTGTEQHCAFSGSTPADRVVHRTFPVSARCVGDGGAGELVPAWVNPAVITGTSIAALATATAAALAPGPRRSSAARTRRRANPEEA